MFFPPKKKGGQEEEKSTRKVNLQKSWKTDGANKTGSLRRKEKGTKK